MNQAPPPHPPASVAQGSTCGLAIGSLVCGILGFLTLITSIPAVILGHISLSKIKASGGALGGKGMAITGLITGYICIAIIPIAALAGLAAPLILRQRAAAERTQMISSMKQIGLSLLEFDQEFGAYPNDGSAGAVLKASGVGVPVSDFQGPNVLRQLEAFGMSEPLDSLLHVSKLADGDWLYYPMAGKSTGPSEPLLVSPSIRGERCVMSLDHSVAPIKESGFEVFIRAHPDFVVIPAGKP